MWAHVKVEQSHMAQDLFQTSPDLKNAHGRIEHAKESTKKTLQTYLNAVCHIIKVRTLFTHTLFREIMRYRSAWQLQLVTPSNANAEANIGHQ